MIVKRIEESVAVKQRICSDKALISQIELAAKTIVESFNNGNKLLLCGNGGSAADAQHIAAELSGRYLINRPPLDAETLTANTSYITAVSNDFSYDDIFSRLIEAKGKKGDIFICISTSGNSTNIIKAIKKAKEIGIKCIGFTGETGGQMRDLCDILINVPSRETPRIQESHIMIGHIICEIVETEIFAKK